MASEKNKAIRLIEYLGELAKLRSKIVRDIGAYQKILWLHEIPKEQKYCYTRVWGIEDDIDEDIWIEIKKDQEPQLPAIPDICEKWVNHDTLFDADSVPELSGKIIEQVEELDNESGETIVLNRTVQLIDNPQIQAEWEEYLHEKWTPWKELHARWQSIHKVYSILFNIYQDQLKLGEEYELAVGIGLLAWKTPGGHLVRRHLITAKASISFEAHLGKFTVRPSTDGSQLDVELDMLDIEEQPPNIKRIVDDGLKSANDNLWDRSSTNILLKAVTNSLAEKGEGDYFPEKIVPTSNNSPEKPVVEYAPALFLRKRSIRGLETTLEEIKKQVEKDSIIPHEFLDLCELDEIDRGSGENLGDEKSQAIPESDGRIYFPLPSNDHQRRIIDTLNNNKGVLVQGPPGTGKSHTITNLICHLLATGKRVLITAKTPRALQVLENMLPEAIKPLCINLLGSGILERTSLEASVRNILSRQDGWNVRDVSQRIDNLEQQIHRLQKDKADTDYKLRALREQETFTHNVAEGAYSGTAAKIAMQLQKESAQHSWFSDKIPTDQVFPLSIEEVDILCSALITLSAEQEKELGLLVPASDDLPSTDTLQKLLATEKSSLSKLSASRSLLTSPEGKAVQQSNPKIVAELVDSINSLKAAVESIRKRPMPWIKKAVFDMLSDNDMPWKELLQLSKRERSKKDLKAHALDIDGVSIRIPKNIDRDKLYHDVRSLYQHFDKGGKIGRGPFKPKIVQENYYIIKNIQVDGRECSSKTTLRKLRSYLYVTKTLNNIWALWSGKAEKEQDSLVLQIAEIDELHEALGNIVALYNLVELAKENIRRINGLSTPAWHDHDSESLHNLLDICQAATARFDLLEAREKLKKIENHLSSIINQEKVHPIGHQIHYAFQKRDIELYRKLCKETDTLCEAKEIVQRKNAVLQKLATTAPTIAETIISTPDKNLWVQRLRNMEKAWAWARGKAWLEDYMEADNFDSLERKSNRLDEDIRKYLAELAGDKAWKFCFSRMKESHRRHLIGWEQAMKKLGKGTGKHAPRHRRTAQQHLHECRDAVPAWVMPLHRVYETVRPEPSLFDVIIVDEASQCGPEALPLMYLAKRILVVGDDKQISPDAVGINREHMHRLMREYLFDFKHDDLFDVENSLFDHGLRRFNNRISLREHFRCMPEIIRFSNDLCYHTGPLIPLRRYPPNRIEPLKAIHVSSGYREGKFNRVINRPEAETLVESVLACCRDERYKNKTMGVIVLQGEAQAYIIENMLLDKLGAEEMERRRLVCGHAYSFQGDERDVIFLSMVAAPNERIGTLTKAADQRRFNVAASRAKDQMCLFHSVTQNDLSESCLRRRLLEYFYDPVSQITKALGANAEELREMAHRADRKIESPPSPFDSWFEVDVALQIATKGYRVIPQYPFAGKRIDMVIEGSQTQLAVECDGDFWHGPEQYEKDMERQRMLERCGWQFYRVRECEYNIDSENALEPLWQQLNKVGIAPISGSPKEGTKPFDGDIDNTEESTSFFESTASRSPHSGDSGSTVKAVNNNSKDDEKISAIKKHEASSLESVHPTDIQNALTIQSAIIRDTIIAILEESPNHSCIKEKLTTNILQKWNIKTRSKPRERFSRRVNRAVSYLDREGYVEIYKSKNVRVRLSGRPYPRQMRLKDVD